MRPIYQCGHPRTAENTVCATSKPRCKTCNRAANKRFKERRGVKMRKPLCGDEKKIMDGAAKVFGWSPEFIVSRKRWREVLLPRFAVMMVMHGRGYSSSQIGTVLQRDHSTVLSGLKVARRLAANDPLFRGMVRLVEAA